MVILFKMFSIHWEYSFNKLSVSKFHKLYQASTNLKVAAKKEKLVLPDHYVDSLLNVLVARLRSVFSMQYLQMQLVLLTVERVTNGVGCAQRLNQQVPCSITIGVCIRLVCLNIGQYLIFLNSYTKQMNNSVNLEISLVQFILFTFQTVPVVVNKESVFVSAMVGLHARSGGLLRLLVTWFTQRNVTQMNAGPQTSARGKGKAIGVITVN